MYRDETKTLWKGYRASGNGMGLLMILKLKKCGIELYSQIALKVPKNSECHFQAANMSARSKPHTYLSSKILLLGSSNIKRKCPLLVDRGNINTV